MHSDDVIYKTPANFDIISYMDTVADELKAGITVFKNSKEKIVTVFGSARTHENEKEYQIAEELGRKLAENGFSVMTGGGPGIMEAALKGAFLNKGQTYGINVILPYEQESNGYITRGYRCKHLFTRKVLLTRNVCGYVILPGGFGTLDEIFDVLTLMNTKIQDKLPFIMIGVEFWSGLIEWLKTHVLPKHYITEEEFSHITLTDDINEVINLLKF